MARFKINIPGPGGTVAKLTIQAELVDEIYGIHPRVDASRPLVFSKTHWSISHPSGYAFPVSFRSKEDALKALDAVRTLFPALDDLKSITALSKVRQDIRQKIVSILQEHAVCECGESPALHVWYGGCPSKNPRGLGS